MLNNVPAVFVAATVITHGKDILVVHSPLWGSYTLPMTKQRADEPWATAAMRAAAECLDVLFSSGSKVKDAGLGKPLAPPKLYARTVDLTQSDRTGQVNVYNFQIFGLELDSKPQLAPGIIAKWLTTDEILNHQLKPISGTARFLIGELDNRATKQKLTFPHKNIKWPKRESVGAVALICRLSNKGPAQWLARWNSNWDSYNFVAGHKHDSEEFRECIEREIQEELGLRRATDPSDFTVSKKPIAQGTYDAWSASAKVDTEYMTQVFYVELGDPIYQKTLKGPLCRWLDAKEIGSQLTSDGKPISETMHLILTATGKQKHCPCVYP